MNDNKDGTNFQSREERKMAAVVLKKQSKSSLTPAKKEALRSLSVLLHAKLI